MPNHNFYGRDWHSQFSKCCPIKTSAKINLQTLGNHFKLKMAKPGVAKINSCTVGIENSLQSIQGML